MVDKALSLPPGTRPVVITSKHQESAHREFYKIEYDHGRRAPIHYATGLILTIFAKKKMSVDYKMMHPHIGGKHC